MSNDSGISRRKIIGGAGLLFTGSALAAYEASDEDSESTGADDPQRDTWNLDVTSRVPGRGTPRPDSGGGGPDLTQCEELINKSYDSEVSDLSAYENYAMITQKDKSSIDSMLGSGPWEDKGTIEHPGIPPFLTGGKDDSYGVVIPGEDSIYVKEMDDSEDDIMDFINGINGEWDDTIGHGLGTPEAGGEVNGPTFIYDGGVVDLKPDLSLRYIMSGAGEFIDVSTSRDEYAVQYSDEAVLSSGDQVAEVENVPIENPTGIDRQDDTFLFKGDQKICLGKMNLSGGSETESVFRRLDWPYGSALTQRGELMLGKDDALGVNQIRGSGSELGLESQQRIDLDFEGINQFLPTSGGFYVSDGQNIQNYTHDGTRYNKTGELEVPGRVTHLSPKTISVVDGSSARLYADLVSPQISFGSENSLSQPEITNNQGPMVSVEYTQGTTAFMENQGEETAPLRLMSYTEDHVNEVVVTLEPGERHEVEPPTGTWNI